MLIFLDPEICKKKFSVNFYKITGINKKDLYISTGVYAHLKEEAAILPYDQVVYVMTPGSKELQDRHISVPCNARKPLMFSVIPIAKSREISVSEGGVSFCKKTLYDSKFEDRIKEVFGNLGKDDLETVVLGLFENFPEIYDSQP